jgi:hypothetical protein
MNRVFPLAMLLMLAGCAAPSYEASQTAPRVTQDRNMVALEDELRVQLNAIRDNPSQASPELIRDIQALLKTLRERQAAAASNPPKKSASLQVAKQVDAVKKPEPLSPSSPVTPTQPQVVPTVKLRSPALAEQFSGVSSRLIYASAVEAERVDQPLKAVALYRQASSLGHAMATKRLMEIYTEGLPGVARNYVTAVKFKNLALRQGADIDEKYAQ